MCTSQLFLGRRRCLFREGLKIRLPHEKALGFGFPDYLRSDNGQTVADKQFKAQEGLLGDEDNKQQVRQPDLRHRSLSMNRPGWELAVEILRKA
ncbi:hypothetical protein KC329_g43 [Hortaea werneckii]|nr:hypothetical protein KC329_g43 [Hortaea werneckii]